MDLFDIRNQLSFGKSIYDIPMRVTYYARVSTEKDEQLHSLSAQVQYYNNFIRDNPNWTYIEGYVDEGLSATTVQKRESFLRMIDDAKLNKFDFIITKEISRFSRSTIDSIKYTQDLLAMGVGVLFQSDNINTLHADAELRLTIMSSIAQDEVRKLSERVRFGFKRAIENGVVLGSNSLWGYKKDNGKLVIVEEEAEMVRHIFDLYANENMGIRGICTWLDDHGYKNSKGEKFAFTAVRNIIVNPKYKGYYCGNKTHKYDYRRNDRKYLDSTEWIVYRDEENVPLIVSEELWDKANRILKKRREKMISENRTSYQNKYLYSGKIICTEHGTPFYRAEFKYKSGSKEVWRCKRYQEKGVSACNQPIVYTAELDDIMKQVINIIVQDKAKIINDMVKIYSEINAKSSIKEDIAKLRIEISEILKMKDKLLDLNIKGKITDDEFESRNNSFNDDIAKLRERIEENEEQQNKNQEFFGQIETLRKMIAHELSFDDALSNGIVESLLDKIEVYKTDDKNVVRLKVFLKVFDETVDYQVKRRRNQASIVTDILTSVCSTPYILNITNRSYGYTRGGMRRGSVAQVHTYNVEIYLQAG